MKETIVYIAVYPDGNFLLKTVSWDKQRAQEKLKEMFDYDIKNEQGITIQEATIITQSTP